MLIGAGVGITPMVSFVRHLVAEGFRLRRTRPTHLIQVARDAQVRAFASELQALVARADGALKWHVVLGQDGAPGTCAGPLGMHILKTVLPFDDHEFFLCGPPGFMQALYDGLRELGVRDERIQAEAFGPASLTAPPMAAPTQCQRHRRFPPAKEATVLFQRSGEALCGLRRTAPCSSSPKARAARRPMPAAPGTAALAPRRCEPAA